MAAKKPKKAAKRAPAKTPSRKPRSREPQQKRQRGTPLEERRAIVARICEHLRKGECSVRDACKRERIARTTLTDWATADPELGDQYARAREEGLREDGDNLMELAATPCADALEAQSVKLQVETLKWFLARRLPKEYGDRQQVDHTGTVTLEQLLERSRQDGDATQ